MTTSIGLSLPFLIKSGMTLLDREYINFGERLVFVMKSSHNVTSSNVTERAELRPETKNKYSAACLPDCRRGHNQIK